MLSLLNGFFIPSAFRLSRLILKKPNPGIIHRLSHPNAAPSRLKSHISKLNSVHKRCSTAASSSNDSKTQHHGNNITNNMDGPRGRSRYSFGRNAALDTFLFTIQGLALFIVFREHVLDVKWISGASMSPYLNKGYNIDNIDSEMVLVDVTYATKLHLRRGMVVVFPLVSSQLFVFQLFDANRSILHLDRCADLVLGPNQANCL